MSKEQERTGEMNTYLNFSVPAHEIDSETLGITLVEGKRLLSRVAYHIDPNIEVSVRVSTPRTGSFEIPMVVVAASYGLAIASPYLPYLQQTMKTAAEYINLWKFLSGKDPKKKEVKESAISVEGDNNRVFNVSKLAVNIYTQDVDAKEATERQFRQLEADKEVESFSILNESRQPIVRVPRKEFPVLASRRLFGTEGQSDQTTVAKTCLVLRKPNLSDKPANWEFIDADGRRISAKMGDGDFLRIVEGGEKFAMGDRLEVELQTQLKFEARLNTHVLGKQEILRVLRHIKRPGQMQIPTEEDAEN